MWWDLLLLVTLLIGSLCCKLPTLLAEAKHCSSLVESICRANCRIWERSVVTTKILFTFKIRSLHFSLHLVCLASCLQSNKNLTRPKRAPKLHKFIQAPKLPKLLSCRWLQPISSNVSRTRCRSPRALMDRLGFEDHGPHVPSWTDSTRLNTAGTDHAGLCSW